MDEKLEKLRDYNYWVGKTPKDIESKRNAHGSKEANKLASSEGTPE